MGRPENKKAWKIGTLNVQSIMNKTSGVITHLEEKDCDICLIQETYIKQSDTAKLQEIRDYGWNIFFHQGQSVQEVALEFFTAMVLLLTIIWSLRNCGLINLVETIRHGNKWRCTGISKELMLRCFGVPCRLWTGLRY